MRIVANVNEPRPDVPDSGQKGVIAIYPAQGAVEWSKWKSTWTLTQPWVDDDAIN